MYNHQCNIFGYFCFLILQGLVVSLESCKEFSKEFVNQELLQRQVMFNYIAGGFAKNSFHSFSIEFGNKD